MKSPTQASPEGDPRVKLTYDDFVLFPDDGKRHELVDGEHYVTPSPNTRHQQISGDLFALIWTYLEAHPVGRVFHAPYDVVFSDFDVVAPDAVRVERACRRGRHRTTRSRSTRRRRRDRVARHA